MRAPRGVFLLDVQHAPARGNGEAPTHRFAETDLLKLTDEEWTTPRLNTVTLARRDADDHGPEILPWPPPVSDDREKVALAKAHGEIGDCLRRLAHNMEYQLETAVGRWTFRRTPAGQIRQTFDGELSAALGIFALQLPDRIGSHRLKPCPFKPASAAASCNRLPWREGVSASAVSITRVERRGRRG
jgi:hypothetical protein